jgi:hypothetical protein
MFNKEGCFINFIMLTCFFFRAFLPLFGTFLLIVGVFFEKINTFLSAL